MHACIGRHLPYVRKSCCNRNSDFDMHGLASAQHDSDIQKHAQVKRTETKYAVNSRAARVHKWQERRLEKIPAEAAEQAARKAAEEVCACVYHVLYTCGETFLRRKAAEGMCMCVCVCARARMCVIHDLRKIP
jgi:hypothetical protein